MKIYTIDYKSHRNNEGTHYNQTIKIDGDLQKRYNDKINREKRKINKRIDENHTFNNSEMNILYFTKPLKKGINYLKHTWLVEFWKFVNKKGLYTKRMHYNRNTIVEVL